jgi:hypothetical protein
MSGQKLTALAGFVFKSGVLFTAARFTLEWLSTILPDYFQVARVITLGAVVTVWVLFVAPPFVRAVQNSGPSD